MINPFKWFLGTPKIWKIVSTLFKSIEAAEKGTPEPNMGTLKRAFVLSVIRQVLKIENEEWLRIREALGRLIDAAVELYNALGVFKK